MRPPMARGGTSYQAERAVDTSCADAERAVMPGFDAGAPAWTLADKVTLAVAARFIGAGGHGGGRESRRGLMGWSDLQGKMISCGGV